MTTTHRLEGAIEWEKPAQCDTGSLQISHPIAHQVSLIGFVFAENLLSATAMMSQLPTDGKAKCVDTSRQFVQRISGDYSCRSAAENQDTYKAGKTTSVKKVAVINPPMTTMAKGLWVSEPIS